MINSAADDFFENAQNWSLEMKALRSILLECGLTETIKWKQPCYIFGETNLFIIGSFKDYCVLSFFNGALLSDEKGILTKPGENTQAGRIIKFTDVKQVLDLTITLKEYIYEAIEVERAGVKFEFAKDTLSLPDELVSIFNAEPDFKTAFNALSPGRQRGYNMYFTAAKQAKTRVLRIEQYRDRIFMGKGIHDCICGLSKRMPTCDGSHKSLKNTNAI